MAKPTAGSTYKVQHGDTLSDIAKTAYGNPDLWHRIYDYPQNHQAIGSNPNQIKEGTSLYIPPLPKQGETYKVQHGDSLSVIAKLAYGKPDLWHKIYNYVENYNAIGSDPNLIKEGTSLYIPHEYGDTSTDS